MAPLTEDVVALRRRFHEWPELGFLEFRTAATVASTLEGLGYGLATGAAAMAAEARMGVPEPAAIEAAAAAAEREGAEPRWLDRMRGGMTAVVAELEGRRPGPAVGFRFDLDALPVRESEDDSHRPAALGFASRRPGLMHACGHDGHAAIGLALAARLADREFDGRVELIFQPAEEGLRGAAAVASSGALDGLDRIFCLHLGLGLPTGAVHGATEGLLASTKRRAVFAGRAAHAGMAPEEGANALLAAAQAVVGLHALPQYAGPGARLNVGRLRAGEAANVVPPSAELLLETRAPTATAEGALGEAARRTMAGAAAGLGVTVEIEAVGGAPEVVCDPGPAALVRSAAGEVPGLAPAIGPHLDSGSEDASWLLERVRENGGDGTYVAFGCSSPGGHHSPEFDLDEAALPLAVELLERLARTPAR